MVPAEHLRDTLLCTPHKNASTQRLTASWTHQQSICKLHHMASCTRQIWNPSALICLFYPTTLKPKFKLRFPDKGLQVLRKLRALILSREQLITRVAASNERQLGFPWLIQKYKSSIWILPPKATVSYFLDQEESKCCDCISCLVAYWG